MRGGPGCFCGSPGMLSVAPGGVGPGWQISGGCQEDRTIRGGQEDTPWSRRSSCRVHPGLTPSCRRPVQQSGSSPADAASALMTWPGSAARGEKRFTVHLAAPVPTKSSSHPSQPTSAASCRYSRWCRASAARFSSSACHSLRGMAGGALGVPPSPCETGTPKPFRMSPAPLTRPASVGSPPGAGLGAAPVAPAAPAPAPQGPAAPRRAMAAGNGSCRGARGEGEAGATPL